MPTETDAIDFLIRDNKLVFEDDIVLSRGVEAIRQGASLRLQQLKGQWFLNLDVGIAWFQDHLGQKLNELKLRADVREQILDTPGIIDILELEVDANAADRVVSITWLARAQFDTVSDSVSIQF